MKNSIPVAMVLSNPFEPDYRVYKEACSLIKNGYRVTIFAWDRSCKFPVYQLIDQIVIKRIRVKSPYGTGILKMNAIFSFWLKTIRIIKQENFSIIHCHDLDTLIIGFFFKMLYGKKVVYDAHENFPKMIRMSSPYVIMFVVKIFEDFLIRFVDAIVTASSVLGDEFRRKTAKPVITIGNWHDLQNIDDSLVQKIRKKYKKDAKLLITYIGNLDQSRSIVPMIEAVRLEREVHFLICGAGAQKKAVVEAVSRSNNTYYIGRIPLAMVPVFTAASDVIFYVMNENSLIANYNAPNSLGFALIAGKPLIASDNGELGRVIKSANCGILVKDSKIDTLRDAIHSFLDEKILIELSKNALNAGCTHYNWSKMEKILVDLYSKLVEL